MINLKLKTIRVVKKEVKIKIKNKNKKIIKINTKGKDY